MFEGFQTEDLWYGLGFESCLQEFLQLGIHIQTRIDTGLPMLACKDLPMLM
jgi:hypothetical protein